MNYSLQYSRQRPVFWKLTFREAGRSQISQQTHVSHHVRVWYVQQRNLKEGEGWSLQGSAVSEKIEGLEGLLQK